MCWQNAVAAAAVETAVAAEMDQKQSPGYLSPLIKFRKKSLLHTYGYDRRTWLP